MSGNRFIKHSSICLKQFNYKYSTFVRKTPNGELLKGVTFARHGQRNVSFVFQVLRGALKIRYIILGSAIGGGVQLSKVINISKSVVLRFLPDRTQNFKFISLFYYFITV